MAKKIAITGGIGSGKSTVLSLIKNKGFSVFSCDEIYREIIRETSYVKEVNKIYPLAVKNGEIDRKSLSKAVFENSILREELNKIAHPRIMQRMYSLMRENMDERAVFGEVPLLFEANLQLNFDEIIVVIRDKELRVDSVMKRDGVSKNEVHKKMEAQFNYDDKEKLKTLQKPNVHFLLNNFSLEKLDANLEKILNKILQP